METKITENRIKAIDKVVNFWVEKSFRTRANQNNGDNSDNGGMAFLIMNMTSLKAQESITEEKIAAFEFKLKELLLNDESTFLTLDVDYHPCDMLAEAAEYAGLELGCFPCKSSTMIDKNDKAWGRYQYGSPVVEL